MCLCSELQYASTASEIVTQEIVHNLEKFLETTYNYLSKNQELERSLPFNLKKKRTGDRTNAEKRISKIFDYNPFEHSTQKVLITNYLEWERNPSKFFDQLQNPPSTTSCDPQQFIIGLCLQVEENDAHSAILRRIYCYVLGGLREKHHSTSAESIGESLHSDLYNGEGNVEELIKAVTKLIEAGSRYKNIADKLGVGSLFVLGTAIPAAAWEHYLPKKGRLFEEAMGSLEQKGIVSSGEVYAPLALKVISILESRIPKPPAVWVAAAGRKSCKAATKRGKRQRGESSRRTASAHGIAEDRGVHPGTDLSPTYGNSMRALASVAEYCLQDLGSQSGGGSIPNNGTHVRGEGGGASRDMDWLSQPHGMGLDNLGGSEGGDTASYHLQYARENESINTQNNPTILSDWTAWNANPPNQYQHIDPYEFNPFEHTDPSQHIDPYEFNPFEHTDPSQHIDPFPGINSFPRDFFPNESM